MTITPAFAIIGGGRWCRVCVTVLAELEVPFEQIVIVSRANHAGMVRFVETQRSSRHSFEVVSSLDELLAHYPVRAAIVANAAHRHFDTALALIDHGVDVLVEKPLTLSSEQARTLLDKAELRRGKVVPGLQYRFCSYLRRFREHLRRLSSDLSSFSLEWADATGEVRYGESKSYDKALDIAQDVMPHVWSILATVFDGLDVSVDAGQSFAQGRGATFDVTVGTLAGSVTLERDAAERLRVLTVRTSSGETCALDFTVEPGSIRVGDQTLSGDPSWHAGPRPLATQLAYFLGAATAADRADDFRACLASVACLERASAFLAGSSG